MYIYNEPFTIAIVINNLYLTNSLTGKNCLGELINCKIRFLNMFYMISFRLSIIDILINFHLNMHAIQTCFDFANTFKKVIC